MLKNICGTIEGLLLLVRMGENSKATQENSLANSPRSKHTTYNAIQQIALICVHTKLHMDVLLALFNRTALLDPSNPTAGHTH